MRIDRCTAHVTVRLSVNMLDHGDYCVSVLFTTASTLFSSQSIGRGGFLVGWG